MKIDVRRARDEIAIERSGYDSPEAAGRHLARLVRWERTPVVVGSSAHEWIFRLDTRYLKERVRDSALERHVAQWFGLSLDQVDQHAVWVTGGDRSPMLLWSFDHCWALYAWSVWLASNKERLASPCLVHFDAHDDLSHPAARSGVPGEYVSPISRDSMSIWSPNSVAAFVQRGWIGIGAFIQPMLGGLPDMTSYFFAPDKGAKSLRGNRIAGGKVSASTVDLHDISPSGPILLDIDLDYFCNDLDDASGRARPRSIEAIRERLARFDRALAATPWLGLVKVITVALSPNFFPSRHWAIALPALNRSLTKCFDFARVWPSRQSK